MTLGAVAFPYVVRPSALGKAGTVAPSERITVGTVGVGPQGTYVMRNFLSQDDCRVVAVCDLKKPVLEAGRNTVNGYYKNSDCAAYADYRELIARPDIDVVHIATCDHWHVLVALEAARAGKDMYLEKPMGLSLAEDQAASAIFGTIFQFGTQAIGRNFRFACELVRWADRQAAHDKLIARRSSGGPRSRRPAPVGWTTTCGSVRHTPHTSDRTSNQWWWFVGHALGFIAGWGVRSISLWGGGDGKEGRSRSRQGRLALTSVCDTAMNWDVTCRYDSGMRMTLTGAVR